MVVWLEYNIGRRVWKLLLVVGVFLLVPSLFASGVVASVLGGASAAVIYSAVEGLPAILAAPHLTTNWQKKTLFLKNKKISASSEL